MKKIRLLLIAITILHMCKTDIANSSIDMYKPTYPCVIMKSPIGDFVLLEPGGNIILKKGGE